MQSEWLRRYFTQQHHGQCQHDAETDDTGAEQDDSGVSRRDFVKSGFMAGMAAGIAAGGVVGASDEAEAQVTGN